MNTNSCGNCKNCDKVCVGTPKEFWACEVYGLHHGYPCPANVTPPNDEACSEWSDTVRQDIDSEIAKLF